MARDPERYREYQREWKRRDRALNPDKHRKYGRDFYARNRESILLDRKSYQSRNSGSIKKRKNEKYAEKPFLARKDDTLRRLYGIGLEEYEAMAEAQANKCAICKETHKLVVDHCHDSGMVRGLLCNRCNTGIGHMRESKEYMLNAISYLAKFK